MAGGQVADITKRAERTALLGRLIETFDAPGERVKFIVALVRSGVITHSTGSLFHELFLEEEA